jgi:hypothetical protein
VRVTLRTRTDTAANVRSFGILRQFKIVVRLEVDPKLRRGSEVASQAQRRVRGDRAAAADNVVDSRHWYEEFGRQSIGGQSRWFQEVLP